MKDSANLRLSPGRGVSPLTGCHPMVRMKVRPPVAPQCCGRWLR